MAKHTLSISDWHPCRLNASRGRHWSVAHRQRRADDQVIAGEALVQRVPRATSPRRVSLLVEVSHRGRLPDGDGFLKSLLDGLVNAGLLVDDGPKWCRLGSVEVRRSKSKRTVIVLEDIEEETQPKDTTPMSDNTSPTPALPAQALIGVEQIAAMLGCSTRHVWRMVDRGLMPQPLKLGQLRRWRLPDIEQWIQAGCPACHKPRLRSSRPD